MIYDKYLELNEIFDADKLNEIIKNFPKYKKQFRDSCFDDPKYDPLLTSKKYLHKSRHSKLKTLYIQKKSYGRYYSRGPSMQSMCREIRHTIAKDYYIDIDIKNAHPVILLRLCQKYDFECEALEEYIKDREKYLKELKIPREQAKIIYLKLTNGGTQDYAELNFKTKHLKQYKFEMKIIHNSFCDRYETKFKTFKKQMKEKNENYNLPAKFMNRILCDEENKILMEIYKKLGKPKDCVLCFDGLMIRKNIKYDLLELEKDIYKKLRYKIKLVVKPFDQSITLNNVQNYIYPRLKFYNDYRKLVNKEIYLEHLEEWHKNSIVLIDNCGCEFFYTHQLVTKSYNDKYKEDFISWEIRLEKTVQQNLKLRIKVINPFFCFNLPDSAEKNVNSKYLFNYLSNTSQKNLGYLEYIKETRKITNYNRVEYIPYLYDKPDLEDTFNTFEGFPLNKIEKNYGSMKFENSAIYKHLATHFFKTKEELNHFLDFIADIIQDPGTIKGTGHLFFSTQGTGKGLICKMLVKLVGSQNAVIIDDIDRYFEKFNNSYKNKLLKIFEEIKEKGGAFKNHDRIKAQITNDTEQIEKKGIDPFQNRHFARFMFNSNNENATYVETGVRRLTYHRLSSKDANDYNYFEPMWNELKDKKFLKCTFDFFKDRKYDKKNVYKSFETKYRIEQKNINLPKGIKFIIDYIENNYETLINADIKIESTIIRNNFKDYCKNEGTRYILSAFKKQIKKIGIDEPKRCTLINASKKKRVQCFVINPFKIESEMKKLLSDETFTFKFGGEIIQENKNDKFIKNYTKPKFIDNDCSEFEL